jgi:hypothetical protein
MKLLIFLFLTCKALLADDYTIQLMSYKYESSLTPSFMKMVNRTGLEFRSFNEDNYKKVCIGRFTTKLEAQRVCKTLKCIPDDVFVRKYPTKVVMPSSKLKEVSSPIQVREKRECSSYTEYRLVRACQIGEALYYLRNSGYYHFNRDGN